MKEKRAHETIMVHYVPLENGLANVHTHGVEENYGHPDLQIVLPLEPNLATAVLNGIVDTYINTGNKLVDGEFNPHLIQDAVAKTVLQEETGRTVFRIILPDPNAKFPEDEGCQTPYNRQYENLEGYLQ